MESFSQQDIDKIFSTFGKDRPHLLRPVDFLVKHREIYGFAVLDQLDALIASCLAAGPHQSHLFSPLIDDGADLIKKLRTIPCMREFAKQELSFLLFLATKQQTQHFHQHNDTHNNNNNNNNSPPASPASMIDFNSKAVPRLMKSRGIINWARTADSRHLRVRIHNLQLARSVSANGIVAPTIFPDSFRLRLTVMWRSVLGHEESECFITGPDLFQAPDMSTTAAIGGAANNGGSGNGCGIGHVAHPTVTSDRTHTGTPATPPQTPTTLSASTASNIVNFRSVSPHNEALCPTSPQVLTHSTNNLFFATNSISSMSFDQSAPSSLPSVNIATTFRTTCDVSCTIRVAVETANGMEFAHGMFRTSFLPGDAAPCASFAVPLQRPTSLLNSSLWKRQVMQQGGNNNNNNNKTNDQNAFLFAANASVSSSTSTPSSESRVYFPQTDFEGDSPMIVLQHESGMNLQGSDQATKSSYNIISSSSSKKDKEVMKKNKEALRKAEKEANSSSSSTSSFFGNVFFSNPTSTSASSYIANRHKYNGNNVLNNTDSNSANNNNAHDSSHSVNNADMTNVGTLAIDIDSIASSFIDIVATMKLQEIEEAKARRRRLEIERLEKEESCGIYENDCDGDDDDEERKQKEIEKEIEQLEAEQKAEKLLAVEIPLKPEEMTVAYFLRDVQEEL